jgi:hypothetical protein
VSAPTRIKAGDMTQDHVGQYVSCHDPDSGFVYAAKIVRITRREEGTSPGVSIWLEHPSLPSGRLARGGLAHVRFDQEFELVEVS